jgi:hypothetical protein
VFEDELSNTVQTHFEIAGGGGEKYVHEYGKIKPSGKCNN